MDPPDEPRDPLALLREPHPSTRSRTRGEIGRLVEAVLGGEPLPSALKRLLVVSTAAAALIIVSVWWWSANQGSTQRAGGGLAPPVTAVPFTTDGGSSTTTSVPELVVHAAGAVARPGLYRIPSGARVGDLIEAAGGLAADADADRLNLAGVLADGARVYVPRAGEIVPDVAVGPQTDGAGGMSPGPPASPGESQGGLVDVNTATAEVLEELPGVGPATAAAIVNHREENGPFRSVDGLLDVRGIGPAKLDALRDLVRVMRPAEELGTGFAVGLAASAVVGAWWSPAIPWWMVALALTWAAWRRHPVVVVATVFLLAGWLGARAWSGLVAPPAGPFKASVTLTTDPEASFGGLRAEARGEGQRFELWVRGPASRHVRDRLAGERLVVTGRVEPLPEGSWLRSRHIVARVHVDDIGSWDEGTPLAQAANHLRRLLAQAADALPAGHRPLFTGMVVGDDRGQDPAVADDFRAAGLTHLLAVSGQNVAFVLALVAPLLTRLGLRSRLVLVLGVLGFFALVTRFEPSVLRATAMAALAAMAATVGRPVPGLRLLAVAVTGLVLLDPFLVRSVGFQLSVAASAGILLLSRPIAEALPGPQRAALAVTVAAQLGVAPVLIPVFGGLPMASVPANLLVGPVAGFVTMWGLTAGLVAGVAGGALADLLLVPVDLALDWIAMVARRVGGWPLGELDLTGALVVAGAAGAVGWARLRRGQRPAQAAAVIAVGIIAVTACLPTVRLLRAPPVRVELAEVGTVWRHTAPTGTTAVLVLEANAYTATALESVRRAGIDHLDLLVVPSGGSRMAELVHQLGRRVSLGQVWAPSGHRVAGASTPAIGSVTTSGGVRLDVIEQRPVLRVDVSV